MFPALHHHRLILLRQISRSYAHLFLTVKEDSGFPIQEHFDYQLSLQVRILFQFTLIHKLSQKDHNDQGQGLDRTVHLLTI